MKPLPRMPVSVRRTIRGVFTDIDDTLTTEGRLTAPAYSALERLHAAGLLVVPITGRPAGWCDHIARLWPVDAVVGENGAFYFRYDRGRRVMHKRFLLGERERRDNRERLRALGESILAQVPGTALASDQLYRESDLAIDYCEDVPALGPDVVSRITALVRGHGATAKVSSIHVNAWFGDYDKLSMTKILMRECFAIDLERDAQAYVFVGDSPNDAPMFGFFPHAVGVGNVKRFLGELQARPAYVTRGESGAGFAEVARLLLQARRRAD